MDAYLGEIRMFAGTFAPVGWELCAGQQLPISQNEALFTLIGTMYGGDGAEFFCLPDLRGRAPVHYGRGPSISQDSQQGDTWGVESVTLTAQNLPPHTHALQARAAGGSKGTPAANVLASPSSTELFIRDTPSTQLGAAHIGPAGGSQPHENRMPYLAINYIICVAGVFPPMP